MQPKNCLTQAHSNTPNISLYEHSEDHPDPIPPHTKKNNISLLVPLSTPKRITPVILAGPWPLFHDLDSFSFPGGYSGPATSLTCSCGVGCLPTPLPPQWVTFSGGPLTSWVWTCMDFNSRNLAFASSSCAAMMWGAHTATSEGVNPAGGESLPPLHQWSAGVEGNAPKYGFCYSLNKTCKESTCPSPRDRTYIHHICTI